MTLEARVWKIVSDRPEQLKPSRLDEERRLEDWLCRDVGLLSDKLLVIGRQISVSGGTLDLLAVDEEGNLVIVELKRDRTARDVVAQTLDYASSVHDFDREDVERHTWEFLQMKFDDAFRQKFGHEPPESVNGRHRMYYRGLVARWGHAENRRVSVQSARRGHKRRDFLVLQYGRRRIPRPIDTSGRGRGGKTRGGQGTQTTSTSHCQRGGVAGSGRAARRARALGHRQPWFRKIFEEGQNEDYPVFHNAARRWRSGGADDLPTQQFG